MFESTYVKHLRRAKFIETQNRRVASRDWRREWAVIP